MIPLFLSSFWVNFHLPIFTGWESANSCTSTIEDTLCSHGWDNWSGQDGQLFTPASLPNLIYGISMVLLEVMPFAFPFAFYFPIFSPVNKCERRGDSLGPAVAEPWDDHQGSSSVGQQAAHPTKPHVLSVWNKNSSFCVLFYVKYIQFLLLSSCIPSWVLQSYSLHFMVLSCLHICKIGNSEVNTGRQSNCSHIRR